jgi:2-phosphosulfolactate phosphatase
MSPSVVIDCFPSSVARYRPGYAIVAIDVIRATTMAITAVASGRKTFFAESLQVAQEIAERLHSPLLAGELGGDMPDEFEMNNSPAELLQRNDLDRPMVLLSSNGTQLMREAGQCDEPGYLACLRNYTATARNLSGRHNKIAIIGAGSRHEFREEDEMCCAWIAEQLLNSGYSSENRYTEEIVARWSGAPASGCCISNSVAYLRRTDQLRDLDFILEHIDDLDEVYTVAGDEIVAASERIPQASIAA